MATASPVRVAPLQPEDWIEAAFARLIHDGIDSVRIELLAKDLGVSKGSFYWHFRDRDDLLVHLLDRWERDEWEWLGHSFGDTDQAGAASRWAHFVERGSEPRNIRAEIAIREWARKDGRVAARFAALEERRAMLVSEVLCYIGFSKQAAESWAETVLMTYQGWLDRAARGGFQQQSSGRPLGAVLSQLLLAASAKP